MDADRLARLVETLLSTPSRRAVMRSLTALLAGSALTPLFGAETEAANRRRRHTLRQRREKRRDPVQEQRKRKKKKKKKKPSPVSPPPPTGALPPSPTCGQSCTGCCAGENCQAGTSTAACGGNGASCVACANPTPLCVNNTCAACTTSTQCPTGSLCDEGACQACTVCASGCLYPNVQSVINDPTGPAVIRICAGTYSVNLTIGRNMTLIGAGDGDGAGDTILAGAGGGSVVTVGTALTVTLRRVRVRSGSTSETGGGIRHLGGSSSQNGSLTLTNCTVTGNSASGGGGGIYNEAGGVLVMTGCSISDNEALGDLPIGGGIYNRNRVTLVDCLVTMNSAVDGGGIVNDGGAVTLNDSIVSENTATAGIGGGIYNESGRVTLLNGSSITGNDADPGLGSGGGIFNSDGIVDASGGSITGNNPDDCVDAGGTGCPP